MRLSTCSIHALTLLFISKIGEQMLDLIVLQSENPEVLRNHKHINAL